MCDDAIHGKTHQASKPKVALVVQSGYTVKWNARLTSGERGNETAQIHVRLVDRTKPLNDGSIDQPKIAAVRDQVRPANSLYQTIVRPPGTPQQRALFPAPPHADNDIIAFAPFLQERGEQRRRALKVRIDLDRRHSTSEPVAGEHGLLKAKIPRKASDPHIGIGAGDLRKLFESSVGGMIIGKQEFELKVDQFARNSLQFRIGLSTLSSSLKTGMMIEISGLLNDLGFPAYVASSIKIDLVARTLRSLKSSGDKISMIRPS